MQVLTSHHTNWAEPSFQPVFMFSHQEHNVLTNFVSLSTASKATIMASADHYLWSHPKSNHHDAASLQPILVPVGEVYAGWVFHVTSQLIEPSMVMSISTVCGRGLYNPHTASGSIIVNNILASTFTTRLPPSLHWHHATTCLAQLISGVLPASKANLLNAWVLSMSNINMKLRHGTSCNSAWTNLTCLASLHP